MGNSIWIDTMRSIARKGRPRRARGFGGATWGAALLAAVVLGRMGIRRLRRGRVRGQVALVTGGSRGLGLLIAEELARAGARVAIAARDESELDAARRHLQRFGEVVSIAGDLERASDVDRIVDAVRAKLGPIDILVNNAGVMEVGPYAEMTENAFEKAMAVHFWAPLRLVRAVVPDMQSRRAGRIVNISSIGGIVAVPHMLPYAASKFALTGFSEGLRAELAKEGIKVTTVCPGLMRTGSVRHALFRGMRTSEHEVFSLTAATPLTSMNARRAARRIVQACLDGEPHVVLTWQAKLAALAHGLAPGLVTRVFGWVNRLLPSAIGEPSPSGTPGYMLPSRVPSWLTRLDERAAAHHNQR